MNAPEKSLRIAATMLLLRDGIDGFELFMVVRHHQIEFASGALVFPGGSLDPGDLAIAARPELVHPVAGLGASALSIRVAAIRETYEESGILLARSGESEIVLSADQLATFAPQRALLAESKMSFVDFLTDNTLVLAADMLVPFAHWITPVNLPKRFDTHFLLAMAPTGQIGKHDGTEAVDSLWVSPKGALDGAASGRFTLLFPTIRNLIKLGKFKDAQSALKAARATPVFTVTPEMTAREGGHTLRIPLEAGYDGDVFDI